MAAFLSLEELVDLVVGAGENIRRRRGRRAAREDLLEQLGQIPDDVSHLQSDETQRGAIVEQDDEDESSRDVREIHRLLLALVKERIEVVLTDQLGQLV